MDEDDIAQLFQDTVEDRHAYVDVGTEVKEALLELLNGVPPELTVGELLKVVDR